MFHIWVFLVCILSTAHAADDVRGHVGRKHLTDDELTFEIAQERLALRRARLSRPFVRREASSEAVLHAEMEEAKEEMEGNTHRVPLSDEVRASPVPVHPHLFSVESVWRTRG